MLNTKLTIYPKQIHLYSSETLNLKLILKRVLITTNHQVSKQQLSHITLKNSTAIISDQVQFLLNRELQLSKSKLCFDIISYKGKQVTFLGNGTLDLIPYANRLRTQVKCRIDRCKDINAYLTMRIEFEQILEEPTRTKLQRGLGGNSLNTEGCQNQEMLVARRVCKDQPTAYEISRRNYKQVQILRDQQPIPLKSTPGSYKKRFQYENRTKGSQSKNSPSDSSFRGSKLLKKSPSPRMQTPQPIQTLQTPSRTKIRNNDPRINQRENKGVEMTSDRQNQNRSNLTREEVQEGQRNQSNDKYQTLTEKLQWIEDRIRQRGKEDVNQNSNLTKRAQFEENNNIQQKELQELQRYRTKRQNQKSKHQQANYNNISNRQASQRLSQKFKNIAVNSAESDSGKRQQKQSGEDNSSKFYQRQDENRSIETRHNNKEKRKIDDSGQFNNRKDKNNRTDDKQQSSQFYEDQQSKYGESSAVNSYRFGQTKLGQDELTPQSQNTKKIESKKGQEDDKTKIKQHLKKTNSEGHSNSKPEKVQQTVLDSKLSLKPDDNKVSKGNNDQKQHSSPKHNPLSNQSGYKSQSQHQSQMMTQIHQKLLSQLHNLKKQAQEAKFLKNQVQKKNLLLEQELKQVKKDYKTRTETLNINFEKEIATKNSKIDELMNKLQKTRDLEEKVNQLEEEQFRNKNLIQKLTKLYQDDEGKSQKAQQTINVLQDSMAQLRKENQDLKKQLTQSQNRLRQALDIKQTKIAAQKINQSSSSNSAIQSQNFQKPQEPQSQNLSKVQKLQNLPKPQKQQNSLKPIKSQISQNPRIPVKSSKTYYVKLDDDEGSKIDKGQSQLVELQRRIKELESQAKAREIQLRQAKRSTEGMKHQNMQFVKQKVSPAELQTSKTTKNIYQQRQEESGNEFNQDLRGQNQVLKQQIKAMQQQLHRLNEMLGGGSSKSFMENSRVKINNSAKLTALEIRLQSYQQELRKKNMQFGQLMNVIWEKGSQPLIQEVTKIVNARIVKDQ